AYLRAHAGGGRLARAARLAGDRLRGPMPAGRRGLSWSAATATIPDGPASPGAKTEEARGRARGFGGRAGRGRRGADPGRGGREHLRARGGGGWTDRGRRAVRGSLVGRPADDRDHARRLSRGPLG